MQKENGGQESFRSKPLPRGKSSEHMRRAGMTFPIAVSVLAWSPRNEKLQVSSLQVSMKRPGQISALTKRCWSWSFRSLVKCSLCVSDCKHLIYLFLYDGHNAQALQQYAFYVIVHQQGQLYLTFIFMELRAILVKAG